MEGYNRHDGQYCHYWLHISQCHSKESGTHASEAPGLARVESLAPVIGHQVAKLKKHDGEDKLSVFRAVSLTPPRSAVDTGQTMSHPLAKSGNIRRQVSRNSKDGPNCDAAHRLCIKRVVTIQETDARESRRRSDCEGKKHSHNRSEMTPSRRPRF